MLDDVVDRGEYVLVVLIAPALPDTEGKVLSVARRAARIGEDDDVAVRSEELGLKVESGVILGDGTTMNAEQCRVAKARIKDGRLDDKALDFRSVGTLESNLLDRAKPNLGKKLFVDPRQLSQLAGFEEKYLIG